MPYPKALNYEKVVISEALKGGDLKFDLNFIDVLNVASDRFFKKPPRGFNRLEEIELRAFLRDPFTDIQNSGNVTLDFPTNSIILDNKWIGIFSGQ